MSLCCAGRLAHLARTASLACCLVVPLAALLATPDAAAAQVTRDDEAITYINAHADLEDMVMVPMRDSVRLYHLIVFPKGQPRKDLPAVLIRSPYLINPQHLGFPQFIESFLKHGYAVVWESVRGRYYSEGTYTYMVRSGEDGYDAVEWIAKQPWSNGKIGALGCSSSAEEQNKLNAFRPPHLAAVVPMAAGAGIGHFGPYDEMGNFYRGGAVRLKWASWYYGSVPTPRPLFPEKLTHEQMVDIHQYWNLDPENKPNPLAVDSAYSVLPINQIMKTIHAEPSDFDIFVNRLPNDPAWKDAEFGDQNDTISAPMLTLNSWYDISIGPNMALFAQETKTAATEAARSESRTVIAPTLHCQQLGATEHTIVGERDLGDGRFDYVGLVQDWFDHFLKGVDNGVTKQPRVRAYMMGVNQWRTYDSWPPKEAKSVTYYLDSDGGANTRLGNGRLTTAKPGKHDADHFTYDPMTPVPTLGGGTWCCYTRSSLSNTEPAGAFNQSSVEMRSDVLVYSTPPLARAVEITGPVTVSLYLSSDRKDTDLTIKLLDVDENGRAYNLDESIQRVRWRDGYDKPVFMQPGGVYKVDFSPLVTSTSFAPGHRIRIEISSSNFPHWDRNLNTGGNNYDEKDPLVAHNVIHHGPQYPSAITLPILPVSGAGASSGK